MAHLQDEIEKFIFCESVDHLIDIGLVADHILHSLKIKDQNRALDALLGVLARLLREERAQLGNLNYQTGTFEAWRESPSLALQRVAEQWRRHKGEFPLSESGWVRTLREQAEETGHV